MEQPYAGSAIIKDSFDAVEVIIPAKKNYAIIFFLLVWICAWTIGETFVTRGIMDRSKPLSLFMLLWLTLWTTNGFFTFRTLLWTVIGREIITVGQGLLSIQKKGMIFYQSKAYAIDEVKDLRVQDDGSSHNNFFGERRNNSMWLIEEGIIRFDYGLRTVRFGSGIDEAEAKVIVEKIEEKFSPNQVFT